MFDFETILHKNIPNEKLYKIADLKSQHWKYPIESQIKWLNDNLYSDDIHLLMYNEQDVLVGYLTISKVNIIIDNDIYEMLGLGNVCVEKNFLKQGCGKQLVFQAVNIIKQANKFGVLLCHNELIEFYKKNGFESILYEKAIVANKLYDNNIMILKNNTIGCVNSNPQKIIIDRNF